MLVTLSGMVILSRLEQSENAYDPMLVTPEGITTSPVQVAPSISIPLTITRGPFFLFPSSQGVSLNANAPKYVTLSGIIILLRLVQP